MEEGGILRSKLISGRAKRRYKKESSQNEQERESIPASRTHRLLENKINTDFCSPSSIITLG